MFKKNSFSSFFGGNSLKKAKCYDRLSELKNRNGIYRQRHINYNELDGASLDSVGFS